MSIAAVASGIKVNRLVKENFSDSAVSWSSIMYQFRDCLTCCGLHVIYWIPASVKDIVDFTNSISNTASLFNLSKTVGANGETANGLQYEWSYLFTNIWTAMIHLEGQGRSRVRNEHIHRYGTIHPKNVRKQHLQTGSAECRYQLSSFHLTWSKTSIPGKALASRMTLCPENSSIFVKISSGESVPESIERLG